MCNSISVKNLRKKYDSFLLNDLSFNVPKGYVTGFIGENGSGKTTTIKSILEMINYDEGKIEVFGKEIKDKPHIKEDVGVVMDLPFFVGDWTTKSLEKSISRFYSRWDKEKYANLINHLDIPTGKKIKDMSKGTKMKLMFAAALSHDAKLLILDEAMSGLDPAVKEEMMEYLRQYMLDENKSIFMSTHITSELDKLADYITYIHDGEIFFSGTKDELLEKYVIVKGGDSSELGNYSSKTIGLRETEVGFSALIESKYSGSIARGVLVEPCTLEEIMVYNSIKRSIYEFC